MESSQYQPPVRRSLSDEELEARVNEATASHNGMEMVMELLVAQESLRAQEDAEIEAWVEKMEAEGSAESLAALAKFQGKDFIPQTDQVQFLPPQEDLPAEALVDEPEPAKPFSWFADEEPEAETMQEESVDLVVVEEEVLEELSPVGEESVEEFEKLLASAAPEETATALEEVSGTAPSNIVVPGDEFRDRKPFSQFLVWIGASCVLTPLLLTNFLVNFGLSAQAIAIDLTLGYLFGALFIATAGLAGKRSGLSTSVISRAVFGVWGNSIPLAFVTISRILIAAVLTSLVLFLGDGIFAALKPFDDILLSFIGLNVTAGYFVGLVFLTVVLIFTLLRGKASRITLLILSLGSTAALLISFAGIFQQNIAMIAPGVEGVLSYKSLAAIAVVFSTLVITWVAVAPNLSKAVPMKPRGWKLFVSVLGAQFALPLVVSLLLLSWIGPAILVTPSVGERGAINGLVAVLPSWTQIVLLVAVSLGLLYMTILNLKTIALDLIALLRIRSRVLSSTLSWVLVSAVLFWFVQQPASRTVEYLVNVFVLAAVFSAGWIGMFVADIGLRRIAYHELSLNRSYGFYGKFNTLSVIIWIITFGFAVGIVPVNLMGLSFTGFLAPSFGLDSSLSSQALGISISVLLGSLITLIARIPQIRKQEKEVQSVESRREQLNDIFIGQD